MSVEASKLAAKIGGSVFTPANPEYGENIRRWAANAVKEASVVVQVSSSADVAAAVLQSSQSSPPNCSFHLQKKLDWRLLLAEADIPSLVHHLVRVVSSLIYVK